MKPTERVSINPLADQFEQQHGPMLDEIHRLVAGCCEGCVIMPKGVEIDGQVMRRSTDEECRSGEIFISADLGFFVDVDDVADSAATALEEFAHELIGTAGQIRANGKKMQPKPAKRKAVKR